MSKKEKFMRFNRITMCTVICIILAFCTCICNGNTNTMHETNNDTILTEDTTVIDTIHTEYLKDSIRKELLDEVTKYIKTHSPHSNSMIPEYLVANGLNEDIDICFMMAQTQIETNFGTAGIGRSSSRKSLFGVYRTYPNYENCVKSYVGILKRHYLVKGRTEKDLMAHYVTGGGARYAKNPHYESMITSAYKKIDRATNITELQRQYNEINNA